MKHTLYEHTFKQISSMSDKTTSSFITLPIELVYRILDKLDNFTILCSMQNVCTRINTIVNTYHRYQVNFFLPLKLDFHHLQNILHLHHIYIISLYYIFPHLWNYRSWPTGNENCSLFAQRFSLMIWLSILFCLISSQYSWRKQSDRFTILWFLIVHADIYRTRSWWQSHQWTKSTTSSQCFTTKQSQILKLSSYYPITISHRHSPHWIFLTIESVIKEESILPML
jgi:hypothetical protein